MNEEKRKLEAAGYAFDVEEKPVTEPGASAERYHVVFVTFQGETLGTRSEVTRERALERAIQFAEKHRQGGNPKSLRH